MICQGLVHRVPEEGRSRGRAGRASGRDARGSSQKSIFPSPVLSVFPTFCVQRHHKRGYRSKWRRRRRRRGVSPLEVRADIRSAANHISLVGIGIMRHVDCVIRSRFIGTLNCHAGALRHLKTEIVTERFESWFVASCGKVLRHLDFYAC